MTDTQPYMLDERRWAALMGHALQGDGAAYERLLREVATAIEAYIRVRFGRIDILEDCVQECLIALHQARHTYDPQRPFRPWMLTIVRHKTIDLLRRRQAWLNLGGALDRKVDLSQDPERLPRLIDGIRVLDGLSPDHREVVALAKYAGYTTAEAAHWLGISEAAVRVRLHRALKAIAKQLSAEDKALWSCGAKP